MFRIAVLLTSHNRKEYTIRCIQKLFVIRNGLDIYLVDDNSSDGTYEAISKLFPKVHLYKGTGDLYWNRGMALAWKNACKKNYDFYIWLNDDVNLYEFAFEEILKCFSQMKEESIVSGVVENINNEVIYGGYDNKKKMITPFGKMKEITYLNGNFVLIPKNIFLKLGSLDVKFHHDLGDVDYGLRAIKENYKVVTTTKPIGLGEVNNICRVRLNHSTLYKRFERLYSPLGANPNIRFYFRKKHFGTLDACLYFLYLIFLNIMPDSMNKFLFKNKHS